MTTIHNHFNSFLQSSWLELVISVALLLLIGSLAQFVLSRILHRFRIYLGKTGKGKSAERLARADTLTGVIQNLTTGILWTIIVLMVLDRFGLNITPLIASAGVLGLAISFGSQEMIKDTFAGFFFLLENQFNVGSTVQIKDKKGRVIKMDLRTVTLRDDENSAIYIFRNSQVDIVTKYDFESKADGKDAQKHG